MALLLSLLPRSYFLCSLDFSSTGHPFYSLEMSKTCRGSADELLLPNRDCIGISEYRRNWGFTGATHHWPSQLGLVLYRAHCLTWWIWNPSSVVFAVICCDRLALSGPQGRITRVLSLERFVQCVRRVFNSTFPLGRWKTTLWQTGLSLFLFFKVSSVHYFTPLLSDSFLWFPCAVQLTLL